MEIQEILRAYEGDLKEVETILDDNERSYVDLIPDISGYIIRSGGKRLRPLLLMIASDLCGYGGERRYAIAAAIEFIHTASLLHDDVIDHADTRRGKKAANRVWGNSATVLVGDYLYSRSFKMIIDDGDPRIQSLLSTTTLLMVEGETSQLIATGNLDITEEEYLSIIEKKTALLISAACASGALLADLPDASVNALGAFGRSLGNAFQVTDDILDYMGDEKEFGKAMGMDWKEGKITLPLIRALSACTPEERDRVRALLGTADIAEDDLGEVISLIRTYGGIPYALDRARDILSEGKAFLDGFPEGKAKTALITLSDYILKRKM
ncbi:MAG TPA: polyprenyl synthetase family protein [Syntrophales bacterium]|nr:polyprenyl synthetase family protein [Syntrophales bacterium]HQN78969.1 polyprenyl synthetase family protein [Syntrophales bacterium]HQQ28214.1 polyprenyl synthetase family protein [Syntrophales bacterium]